MSRSIVGLNPGTNAIISRRFIPNYDRDESESGGTRRYADFLYKSCRPARDPPHTWEIPAESGRERWREKLDSSIIKQLLPG